MTKRTEVLWSLFGLAALAFGCHLLYRQIRDISLDELTGALGAISWSHWVLCILAAAGAYLALAWYDAIGIKHLKRKVPKRFIALCSFTAYALGHNIGASLFSGAVVRYRGYSTKGLSGEDVGILILICSITFVLAQAGTIGLVLMLEPSLIQRFSNLPTWAAYVLGVPLLSLIGLYVLGSWRHFRPRRIGRIRLVYPRLNIVREQLFAGPLELFSAAAIIYFALPADAHLNYLLVLGVFMASFTLALWSNAPGGLGVLEFTFINAMPELKTADVLAALIVFRCLYMLLPFTIALVIATVFELKQWRQRHSS